MDKIISLHTQKCTRKCEHSLVCYLKKRPKVYNKRNGILKEVSKILEDNKTYKCYYSLCVLNKEAYEAIDMCLSLDNFFITLSVGLLNKVPYISPMKLQVTINENVGELGIEYQQLHLIKDEPTYEYAIFIIKNNIERKVHFPIEHNWASKNKDKLDKLIKLWLKCKNPNLSLDSCLENYMLNKTCVYNCNYIDISNDGTYRRCPFSIKGKKMGKTKIIDLFNIEYKQNNCIYNKLWR